MLVRLQRSLIHGALFCALLPAVTLAGVVPTETAWGSPAEALQKGQGFITLGRPLALRTRLPALLPRKEAPLREQPNQTVSSEVPNKMQSATTALRAYPRGPDLFEKLSLASGWAPDIQPGKPSD